MIFQAWKRTFVVTTAAVASSAWACFRYKEICHGGRLFTNARDQEILRIVD